MNPPIRFGRAAVPISVMSVDFRANLANVCAWCPEKKAGDDWAARSDFRVSHGMCPECAPKLSGEAPARPSCAVSSATAGRDRQQFQRADYIAVSSLARLVALTVEEIVASFGPLHFRPGYDFQQLPAGVILRRAVLPELVGGFATSGRTVAAARLLTWLRAPVADTPPLVAMATRRPAAATWYAEGAMA
ncbi:MAG: hypothetical protein H7343_00265 [Undibacterium sp.]|nr:hypothetical protein [Opitutaceae bacterium]